MIKTKIVCTLGPATDDPGILKELMASGMNVARLNFSHGTHDEHKKRAELFKAIRREMNIPSSLMLDTKGPEVRLGQFENGMAELKTGEGFILTTEKIKGTSARASVTYGNLHQDVKRGDRILIDEGIVELSVIRVTGNDIYCEVINGNTVSGGRHVNLPGVSLGIPFIGEQDKEDIAFGASNDFDYIAASFVRCAQDVKDMRDLALSCGWAGVKIIAKIENREGVTNIDEILRVSDGVMVARGDMGVEIPFEELPWIQKEIIRKGSIAGKPVITATQMLDSMIRNSRPTRAEITDVANAIYDGTSAIMLSGETSVGKFPVESVQTMVKIAAQSERTIDYASRFSVAHPTFSQSITNAISHSTCASAHLLRATAIITVTKSGHTARMVSKYRPASQIIAVTMSEKILNVMALYWGVLPVLAKGCETTDEVFNEAISRALETGQVKNGDLVVITGGTPTGISGTTNTMKIHIIGDVLLKGRGMTKFTASGTCCIVFAGIVPEEFNAGDVLIIEKTSDELLPFFKSASAIVTEEDAEDSPAVVVGKTLGIPVITGAIGATGILKSGTVVCVDGDMGQVRSVLK